MTCVAEKNFYSLFINNHQKSIDAGDSPIFISSSDSLAKFVYPTSQRNLAVNSEFF